MYKLLLNWKYIYEIGEITGFAKIKREIEEFLLYFTVVAVTYIIAQLLQPDYYTSCNVQSHNTIIKLK